MTRTNPHTELAIVFVNWNGAAFLCRAVESVVAFPPSVAYEVVVIDNASTDDSISLLRSNSAAKKLIETHQRFNRVERALVVDNLKLVWSTVGKHELYDLSNDPDEERDLCGLDQATCAGLQAKLEEWRALIPRSQSPAVKLDRDGLGRLRNLGYIQ